MVRCSWYCNSFRSNKVQAWLGVAGLVIHFDASGFKTLLVIDVASLVTHFGATGLKAWLYVAGLTAPLGRAIKPSTKFRVMVIAGPIKPRGGRQNQSLVFIASLFLSSFSRFLFSLFLSLCFSFLFSFHYVFLFSPLSFFVSLYLISFLLRSRISKRECVRLAVYPAVR